MKTKICSKCYIEKDLADFGKKITNKDGLQSRCKECRKIESKEDKEKNYNRIKGYRVKNRESLSTKNKEWRKNNPGYDKVWKEKNKEKVKESKKKTYEKHKDIINLKKKEYREKNRERLLELGKEYREKNREEINRKRREKRILNNKLVRENERKRFKENPHLKLIANYRCRVKNYLRYNKSPENTHTIHIVGLTPIELKDYVESKFTDGMTWENYGMYGWHIDHIIPLSSAKDEQELIKLCHYSNLQPLWSFDNISKGSKILIS